MRKDEIIGRCLLNSNMFRTLEDAKFEVKRTFQDDFPGEDFVFWNTNIDDRVAKDIIYDKGRASQIRVKLFIKELWK